MLIVFSLVCALVAPWQYLEHSPLELLGIKHPEKFARLQVTALAGDVQIWVDDELKGSVGPEGSPLLIEDIAPGQRLVKLIRKSENEKHYIRFERLTNFSADIDTVIAYELGPTNDFSGGHVISAFKNYADPNGTKLNITTVPGGAKVILNNKELGNAPLSGITLDTSVVNRLKLELLGYESIEMNLLSDDATQREKLKGYEINVEANLFLLPLRV